jgi:hypothetical protein
MANIKPSDYDCRICGEHLHSKQELEQHTRENHAGQQATNLGGDPTLAQSAKRADRLE